MNQSIKLCLKTSNKLIKSTVLATLMMASSAHAGLIVTSATRSLSVNNGHQPSVSDTESASGVYDNALTSTFGLPGEAQDEAFAKQNTFIGPLIFSGNGTAMTHRELGHRVLALSQYIIAFTLTDTYSYSGFADLSAQQDGGGDANTRFTLQRVGGSFVQGADNETPLLPFSGQMAAGDYLLKIKSTAGVNFFDYPTENGFGVTSFDFKLAFTELPPTSTTSVPEPGSLAMLLAGAGVAFGAMRRRQTA